MFPRRGWGRHSEGEAVDDDVRLAGDITTSLLFYCGVANEHGARGCGNDAIHAGTTDAAA